MIRLQKQGEEIEREREREEESLSLSLSWFLAFVCFLSFVVQNHIIRKERKGKPTSSEAAAPLVDDFAAHSDSQQPPSLFHHHHVTYITLQHHPIANFVWISLPVQFWARRNLTICRKLFAKLSWRGTWVSSSSEEIGDGNGFHIGALRSLGRSFWGRDLKWQRRRFLLRRQQARSRGACLASRNWVCWELRGPHRHRHRGLGFWGRAIARYWNASGSISKWAVVVVGVRGIGHGWGGKLHWFGVLWVLAGAMLEMVCRVALKNWARRKVSKDWSLPARGPSNSRVEKSRPPLYLRRTEG